MAFESRDRVSTKNRIWYRSSLLFDWHVLSQGRECDDKEKGEWRRKYSIGRPGHSCD